MKTKLYTKIIAGMMAMAMLGGTCAMTAGAADTMPIGGTETFTKGEIPLNGSGSVLEKNKTYKLPTIISGLTGIKYDVSVNNNKVAKIQGNELVTVGYGDVNLTVTLADGTSFTKTFRVERPQISVKFETNAFNLTVGQTKLIKAIVSQSKAKLTWKSSNSNIVSVDQNGKITAKRAGLAAITAKTSTGKTTTCTVRVGSPVAVEKVLLNAKNVTLHVGDTFQLHGSVAPAAASDKSLKCKTSNAKVASVSYGKIKANSVGKAKITVTSTNGKTSVCTVTVVK